MPEAHMSPPTDDETTEEPSRKPEREAEQEGQAPERESAKPEGVGEPGESDGAGEGGERSEEFAESGDFAEAPGERPRMTPRQARRVRIVVSGLVMLAVAVVLAVRVATAPSVLTVGFYGVALILSGSALVLSRRGRTRVATGVLALGVAVIVAAEWLLA